MRDPIMRTRKYDAKIDAEAIRLRIAAHRDSMVEQEEAMFAMLSEVERKAKRVCETAGINTIDIPFYLDFARQCWKISRNFSGATQINEVYYRYQTWVNRGLATATLDRIAELCGVELGDYPAP